MTIDIDKLRQALGAVQPEEVGELLDRLEAAEEERDFAKTEIARLHDDIRELTGVRVLDEEDRDRIVAWRQGTATKPAPSVPDVDALAQFIREVDGSHQLGAGVLAERIAEWLKAAPEAKP